MKKRAILQDKWRESVSLMDKTRDSFEYDILSSPSYDPESALDGIALKSSTEEGTEKQDAIKITPKANIETIKANKTKTCVFKPFESFMATEDTVQQLRKIFSRMKKNDI